MSIISKILEQRAEEALVELDEAAESALAKKAEASGVSLSILKKVYRRGVAAWNSGHRPGTTPQQWGMARVNSYITKGKGTYHGADKDLREDQEVVEDTSDPRFHNKKYQKGMDKKTAAARVAHWKKMDKLSDKDPRAYQPAPGDATAKTKESEHTKKYHAMYGESFTPSQLANFGFQKVADSSTMDSKYQQWRREYKIGSPNDRHISTITVTQDKNNDPVITAQHEFAKGYWSYAGEGPEPKNEITHKSTHLTLLGAAQALADHVNDEHGSQQEQELGEATQIDELSNATLASYKKKASADATASDKAGNFKKADKRFSGIVKATNKQFANDIKKEEIEMAEERKSDPVPSVYSLAPESETRGTYHVDYHGTDKDGNKQTKTYKLKANTNHHAQSKAMKIARSEFPHHVRSGATTTKFFKEEENSDEKKMEVQDTSDYKTGKDGRKVRAHKLVFNKGEDEMNPMKEDKEQIDEISKKTLGSYVKKASLDAMSGGFEAGAKLQGGEGEKFNKLFNKASKRLRGIDKASDRLAKEETIDERELTDAEMKERERIVKGMKKKAGDFEAKYGDRAKSVMYATATKLAKESLEALGEAPMGVKHKVQIQYKTKDGYAAKHVIVHAPNKEAAKRYAVSDHQKKGYEEVKALRASTYKPVSEQVVAQVVEEVMMEQEQTKHRVGVTLSEPDHHMASMRKETQQRFIKLSATSKEEAVKKAIAHYKKQGYKVHDAFHHSEIKEELVGNQHKLDIDNNGKIDSQDLKKVRKGVKKFSDFRKEQQ